jgi:hypothetical protein
MRSSITAFRFLAATVLGAGVFVGPAAAGEQPGLRSGAESPVAWPRVAVRLGLGLGAPAAEHAPGSASLLDAGPLGSAGQITSLNVLGDVYFPASSRFRATGGVLLGARARPWSSSGLLAAQPGTALVIGHRGSTYGADDAYNTEGADAGGTVPYLGVGYSDAPSGGGWGFSADVGVLALAPRSAVRLGRVLSGQQTFDDMVRELRLTPSVQVGVSYSF